MTNETLALSYFRKASDRLDVLDLLLKKEAYSDVIREAQECVELALKAMLRYVGGGAPKDSRKIYRNILKKSQKSRSGSEKKENLHFTGMSILFQRKITQSKMRSKLSQKRNG
jgi:HEPN domain-containing protein